MRTYLVEFSRQWIIHRIFIQVRQSDDGSMTTATLTRTRLGNASGDLIPGYENERPTGLKGDSL